MKLYKAILRHKLKPKKITSYNRFLFIGPHPDDIELGCGSLAAKLSFLRKKVCFLICTDGRYGNKYCSGLSEEEIISRRKNECYSSTFELNIFDVRFLNFSDGGFYSDSDMCCQIAQVIGEVKPDVVFVTDPDVISECHTDHKRIGNIVKTLVSQNSNSEIMKKYNAKPADIKAIAFYFSAKPNCVVRAKKLFNRKLRAIFEYHTSQFPKDSTDSIRFQQYLKFKKKHRQEESFRLVEKICTHCLPEADR